jgi:hypothetical protein
MFLLKKSSKPLKPALEQFHEIANDLGAEIAYGEDESDVSAKDGGLSAIYSSMAQSFLCLARSLDQLILPRTARDTLLSERATPASSVKWPFRNSSDGSR